MKLKFPWGSQKMVIYSVLNSDKYQEKKCSKEEYRKY